MNDLYWPLVTLILGLAFMGSLWVFLYTTIKVHKGTETEERIAKLETEAARAVESAEEAKEYASSISKRIAGIEHLTRWSKRA